MAYFWFRPTPVNNTPNTQSEVKKLFGVCAKRVSAEIKKIICKFMLKLKKIIKIFENNVMICDSSVKNWFFLSRLKIRYDFKVETMANNQ